MKGCIFVSFRYLDTDTISKSWLKMYLRTRYRSKLGWFFWFGLIHVTICSNLAFYDCKFATCHMRGHYVKTSKLHFLAHALAFELRAGRPLRGPLQRGPPPGVGHRSLASQLDLGALVGHLLVECPVDRDLFLGMT